MNEYKNYLVTLTPLGHFFFGGRKRSEAEKEKDYYFKSRYFPQQTAVLGMLRQELLMQNGFFPLTSANRENAARLIGEKSFNPEIEKQDFGSIQEISPVMIHNNGRFFHPCPKDMDMILETEEGKSYLNLKDAVECNFIQKMKKFDPKTVPLDSLIVNDSSLDPLTFDKVFTNNEQIGIKKGESGQIEEKAFYKQVFLRMEKGFSFAFYLRLKTIIDKKHIFLNNNIILMGGERSAFKMELKDVTEQSSGETVNELFEKTLPHIPGTKIVLFSDAFVDNDVLNHCRFAVTGSIFFRNIRTNVKDTRKFYNLTSGDREGGKTPFLGKRYNLLTRGSVLYVNDNTSDFEKVKEHLDKPQFQKIGYNYYKIYTSHKGENNDKE